MFEVHIDQNTLIAIIIICIIVLISITFIFIAFMCHDKRRFKSVDRYNELLLNKSKTYDESVKEYYKNVEKSGVNTKFKPKINLILSIIKLFDRKGSKWPFLFLYNTLKLEIYCLNEGKLGIDFISRTASDCY